MELAFRSNFADHSPEAAQEIVGRQEQGAERAANQRGAYGELAADYGNSPDALRQRILDQKKREGLAGRMELAAGNADIAEQNARGAMAQRVTAESTFGKDPEVMKANIEAQRAMARAQANKATAEATTASAASDLAGTESAYASAGIRNPETWQQDSMKRAVGLGSLMTGFVGRMRPGDDSGSVRATGAEAVARVKGFISQSVTPIEQMAQADPEEAARLAASLLEILPQPNENGEYTFQARFYDSPEDEQRSGIIANRLNDAYSRLIRVRDGGGNP
jgi:hypothetical protein